MILGQVKCQGYLYAIEPKRTQNNQTQSHYWYSILFCKVSNKIQHLICYEFDNRKMKPHQIRFFAIQFPWPCWPFSNLVIQSRSILNHSVIEPCVWSTKFYMDSYIMFDYNQIQLNNWCLTEFNCRIFYLICQSKCKFLVRHAVGGYINSNIK